MFVCLCWTLSILNHVLTYEGILNTGDFLHVCVEVGGLSTLYGDIQTSIPGLLVVHWDTLTSMVLATAKACGTTGLSLYTHNVL